MSLNDKINIIITDDNPQYIEGLKILFSTSPKYQVLDVYENGLQLVMSKKLHLADLLLIDIDMPIMNGVEAAKKVNIKYPHIPMIAITMHQDKVYLNNIIGVGFNAFVDKSQVVKTLFSTIQRVLNNDFVFPDNLEAE